MPPRSLASPVSRRSSTTACAIRPAQSPLALSIDLTVQAAVEEVLHGGMTLMNASAASAVLMDIAPARSSRWRACRISTPTRGPVP
jgi:hypothetical protein